MAVLLMKGRGCATAAGGDGDVFVCEGEKKAHFSSDGEFGTNHF